MEITPIDDTSPHFETVLRLGKENRKTLGFLPKGGYLDYARERRVIAAVNQAGTCIGYLLYRLVRDRAIIAHFCVAKSARKQGCGRQMMNWLIQTTKKQQGILLTCRKDFEEASKTWERLGFQPIGEKPARARGKVLVVWWQGHGHKDLFSGTLEFAATKAVVDANVFFDIVDGTNEESGGLLADWLRPFISVCYTGELLIEIDRNKDKSVARSRRRQLSGFELLESSAESFHRAEQLLLASFPSLSRPQDKSDFRQLVRAIAADADVFVTRDGELRAKSEEVLERCGLLILLPGELAAHIDTLVRKSEYQRRHVAGTHQISRRRIERVDNALIDAIKTNDERRNVIGQPLARYLSEPHRFNACQVTDSDGTVLAVYVVDRKEGVDQLPMFRVSDTKRSGTLARTILAGVVREAVLAGCRYVLVTDSHVDASACADLGFLRVENGWLKLVLTGWRSIDEVSATIDSQALDIDDLKVMLEAARSDATIASELEHILWPAKLADAPIPSYVVSIQRRFAEQLFDVRLANQSLIGRDVDLALNVESAYYRSARPGVLTAPGRVLWYVSKCDRYQGTMGIRACSRIVEVMRGRPSPLFKKLERLGVFGWRDVLAIAKGKDIDIMAFRFDDSEALRPIPRIDALKVLNSYGIRTNFLSPVAIPREAFGELYTSAFDPSQIR